MTDQERAAYERGRQDERRAVAEDLDRAADEEERKAKACTNRDAQMAAEERALTLYRAADDVRSGHHQTTTNPSGEDSAHTED
jgi:hypothetical protein